MDALSQLSYTPVSLLNKLQMVWQTENILTNIPSKFHSAFFSASPSYFFVYSVFFPPLVSLPQRENFH